MEIKRSDELIPYEAALAEMEARVAAIRAGEADEMIWLLEHPPLYTAGTSAKVEDLLDPRFPVYQAGRGGEYTYHGPGQRVAYVMLDLKKRQQVPDIKKYVWQLEEWIIRALALLGVTGERRAGRIGIWVQPSPEGSGVTGQAGGAEKKIAAIGVRVRRWVAYHGIAINVQPDLSHFGGIVPCGISEYGVTSLADVLGRDVALAEIDEALRASWDDVFGAAQKVAA